jgi:hypothetical protein
VHRRTGLRRAQLQQLGTIDFSTGVIAGTYGDASHVGRFTVDPFGRLLDAGNVAIVVPASGISGLAPIATSGLANDLTGGTVPVARMPQFFGGSVVGGPGSTNLTLQSIPAHVPVAGEMIFQNIVTPASPGGGLASLFADNGANGTLACVNSFGFKRHMIATQAAVANQYLTQINDDGSVATGPVALGNLAAVAANSVVGNFTGGLAAPAANTAAQLRAFLGPAGRLDLQRAANGIVAETAPFQCCTIVSGAGNIVTQIVYLQAIYLLAGDVLTNALVNIAGDTGGTITMAKVGLYNGTNLATQTANLTNTWKVRGFYSHALAPTYTVPASGLYQVAFLVVFTVQDPAPLCATTAAVANTRVTNFPSANTYAVATIAGTFSDLPATITGGDLARSMITPWIGFS